MQAVPEGSTVPVIEQLRRAARFNEDAARELDGPECPPIAVHVWGFWCELHEKRESGMGTSTLTWEGIESYCRMHGIEFTPLVETIFNEIERTYLRFCAKKPEPDDEDEPETE